jgi:hypothetical protein
MGMPLFSCSSYDKVDNKNINLDSSNYRIIKSKKIDNFLILFINYPNCTNFEGNKILVYINSTIDDLYTQRSIDPHFSDNKNYISPIARFIPTDIGWKMAEFFCSITNLLIKEDGEDGAFIS